jgi:hypothetical protein
MMAAKRYFLFSTVRAQKLAQSIVSLIVYSVDLPFLIPFWHNSGINRMPHLLFTFIGIFPALKIHAIFLSVVNPFHGMRD